MTGSTVSAAVEWAWRGKTPGDRGYRVLSWSTGTISASNFEDILDRFFPGTLETLPQVAVSYVLAANGSRYLGLAIYESQEGSVDRVGRDVTFTRYFCVPYQEIASGAVSYLAMYRALRELRLPGSNESPLSVEFTSRDSGIPDDAARALQVAQLLLTGNPVCIVGADQTSVADRLAFIDAVMLLLPYGMRAEMAAATWTSSVYRSHKFRLFFSEAPRRPPDSGPEDHLVAWRPDELQVKTALTPRFNPEWGEGYRDGLKPMLEKPVTAKLAGLTEPIPFRSAEILKVVETAQSQSQSRWWRKRGAAPNAEAGGSPAGDDQQVRRLEPKHARTDAAPLDGVEATLLAFDGYLRAGNTPFVESGMRQIPEMLAKSPPTEAQRQRYQAIIKDARLLRDELPLGRWKHTFYKVLLRAVFGVDIGYADFLRILDMLGEETAQKPLLQVIDEASADPRVKFIVLYHLNDGQFPRSRHDRLIDIAADPELRDDHAALIWDATIVALGATGQAERGSVRNALRERGFLATRLRARAPNDLNRQSDALSDLLRALYGDQLDEYACREIFTGNRNAPTEALLLAAFRFINPETVSQLLVYFIDGLLSSPELGPDIRASLVRLGYGTDAGAFASGPDAARPMPETPPAAARWEEVADYLNSMKPDPPGPRRGPVKRVMNPSGTFTAAEEKKPWRNDER